MDCRELEDELVRDMTYAAPETITIKAAGGVGVDLNADCLALSESDRYGNLIHSAIVDCMTYGKTSNQRKTIVGDTVKVVVAHAAAVKKPIVIEKLDFSKKKAELETAKAGKARMLSALAYSLIQSTLRSACFRAGVEVIDVTPAYTSTIGAVNYAQRYGISTHQGAAFAIARRGLGFSEKPPRSTALVPLSNGAHGTFPVPVRKHGKHVWTQWAAIRTKLAAAHVAHARSGECKSSPAPLRPQTSLCSYWTLPVGFRHTNRRENCSPGVVDEIPW